MLKIKCGHFRKIINNCILWNKLTKKYADHNNFCVDHAHIFKKKNYWCKIELLGMDMSHLLTSSNFKGHTVH